MFSLSKKLEHCDLSAHLWLVALLVSSGLPSASAGSYVTFRENFSSNFLSYFSLKYFDLKRHNLIQ